jgi:hypothetical protein
MSKSFEGAVLLSVAAIMIVSMDNFFGLGYLSSRIFGVTWNWAKVYPPLHRKLGVDRSEDVSLELAQNSDQKAEATDSLLTSTNPKDSV